MQRFAKAIFTSFLGIAFLGCSGNFEEDFSEGEGALVGTFEIRIGHSGKCVDVRSSGTTNGTNIHQWNCNGTGAQHFRAESINGGFRFINPQSGRCLDISGSSTANGGNLQLWDCNGTGAQTFRVQDAGGGSSRLVNVTSNKCLDVDGGGTQDGANIHQWDCHSGNNQRFSFVTIGGSGGGGGGSSCNYPNWVQGQWYDAGAIVKFTDGKFYRAKHANPGYSPTISTWYWEPYACSGGSGGSGGGSGGSGGGSGGSGGGSGGQSWSRANLTWYTSWPACCPDADSYDPNADPTECVVYNGCTWAGYFAGVSGRKPESWVRANNIAAVHEKDFAKYRGKTLRVRQNGRQIDAVVYDKCADSDCNGCCTRNAQQNGLNFLLDLESHTKNRFGSGSGIVEWTCLDCD